MEIRLTKRNYIFRVGPVYNFDGGGVVLLQSGGSSAAWEFAVLIRTNFNHNFPFETLVPLIFLRIHNGERWLY